MELVLVLLLGLAIGFAIGWAFFRASGGGVDTAVIEARHELALAQVRQAESAARTDVEAQLAAARASVEGLDRELGGLREQLKRVLDEHARETRQREAAGAAESKVLQQMAPIAEQLKAMHQKVDVIEKQRHEQHGKLEEQIKHTRLTAEQSRAAAETLASALRNNQVRGAYGEIQLESIVEAAGMLKRVDFTTQASITADSGARRPDMVVRLPGGKELAVDAKVPYNAFIEANAAGIDDAQRTALLKDHARAVRAHVNALADKNYFTGLTASPEFTVAFIPNDAILTTAIDADPTLESDAYRKGVVLATPGSLFGILKSLAFTWRQEDLAENAREVVTMGQVLLNRLSTVAKHASKLGRSIERSVKDYNTFAGSMQTQLLVQARRFDGVELPSPKEIEEGTREFTAAEFSALDELDDVARPELEYFDETMAADAEDERTA
jgi:DNA recombination protein RmuC